MNKVNKMIIDKEEFIISDYVGNIEINVNKLTLIISGNVVLNEMLNRNLDLTINLEDNSTLVFNRFGNLSNNETKIVINQGNNTNLELNEAFISDSDSKLVITNNINGNNNKSDIIVRAIGSSFIKANLNVLKNTINNELKEDLKGLELDNSKISIIPNMLVASSEVSANHFVTIGNVREEDLFYLRSKGLTRNNAINLLKTGFLVSIFKDNDIKELIKETIK